MVLMKKKMKTTYVFFTTWRQFLLRKLERIRDPSFANIFDQTLLLQMKEQLWVGIQDLQVGKGNEVCCCNL